MSTTVGWKEPPTTPCCGCDGVKAGRCCVGKPHPPGFASLGQQVWVHLTSFHGKEVVAWAWSSGKEVWGPQDGLSCGTRTVDTLRDSHIDDRGAGRHEKYS